MTDWVKTKIVVSGNQEKIDKMFSEIMVGNDFDFNKIIPMPRHIYKGNVAPEHRVFFGAENCWTYWCLHNWGVERLPVGCKLEGNCLEFCTVSSFPRPIIRALVAMYDELNFTIWCATEDESAGCIESISNWGHGTLSLEIKDEWYCEGETKALEIYEACWGKESEDNE